MLKLNNSFISFSKSNFLKLHLRVFFFDLIKSLIANSILLITKSTFSIQIGRFSPLLYYLSGSRIYELEYTKLLIIKDSLSAS